MKVTRIFFIAGIIILLFPSISNPETYQKIEIFIAGLTCFILSAIFYVGETIIRELKGKEKGGKI